MFPHELIQEIGEAKRQCEQELIEPEAVWIDPVRLIGYNQLRMVYGLPVKYMSGWWKPRIEATVHGMKVYIGLDDGEALVTSDRLPELGTDHPMMRTATLHRSNVGVPFKTHTITMSRKKSKPQAKARMRCGTCKHTYRLLTHDPTNVGDPCHGPTAEASSPRGSTRTR